MVAGRAARRGRPSDPVRQARRPRRANGGGRHDRLAAASASPAPASTAPTICGSTRRSSRRWRRTRRRGCCGWTALDPVLDADGPARSGAPLAGAAGQAELIFLGLAGERAVVRAAGRRSSRRQRAWSVFGIAGADGGGRRRDLWATARSLIEWHNRHGSLRPLRRRRRRASAAAGGGAAPAAASSISRASIRS